MYRHAALLSRPTPSTPRLTHRLKRQQNKKPCDAGLFLFKKFWWLFSIRSIIDHTSQSKETNWLFKAFNSFPCVLFCSAWAWFKRFMFDSKFCTDTLSAEISVFNSPLFFFELVFLIAEIQFFSSISSYNWLISFSVLIRGVFQNCFGAV